MNKYRQIRNYEVSVWTLQDSFITVLKWAGIESKGQIQDGIQILDVDGTQEFTFTIPMYLNSPDDIGNNIKKENPIWYNTKNGNLMASMRKIKLILNKQTDEEKIYEYIITKVEERHEKEELYCDVSCEGLALHELGKIGYKLALSSDDFYYDYGNWFKENNAGSTQPCQTIQYWNNKFLTPYPEDSSKVMPNIWYYEVKIDYGLEGELENKYNNKIYEDDYVTSWEVKNGAFVPSSFSTLKEKERAIDIKESNIYNITQKIAETFKVFCKYEYVHDENYHIIAKKVIYYNNYINDLQTVDLTYPYQAKKISREMDGTDLVTKLYVCSKDNDLDSNIINVKANKSREDYILNFDYLYLLNVITEDQYKEVDNYEQEMFNFNVDLEKLENRRNVLLHKISEGESKLGFSKKAVISAQEQKTSALEHLRPFIVKNEDESSETEENNENIEIKDEDYITIDKFNSKLLILAQEENSSEYYVNLPFIGIDANSIKLIKGDFNYSKEDPLEDGTVIQNGTIIFDDFGNAIKIANLPKIDGNLWLQCKYNPAKYWKKVYDYWSTTYDDENEQIENLQSYLNSLNAELEKKNNDYEDILLRKKDSQKKFEKMMGPALREGYWQPENYLDYNERRTKIGMTPSYREGGTNSDIFYYWQLGNNVPPLTEEEKTTTFKIGNAIKNNILIDLSNLYSNPDQLDFIKTNYDKLNFIYYDYTIVDLNKDLNSNSSDYQANLENAQRMIPLGGGCKFGFIRKSFNDLNYAIVPVLIITDSYKFSHEQLMFFKYQTSSAYNSRIGFDTGTKNDIIIDADQCLFYVYEGNPKYDLSGPSFSPTYLRIEIISSKLNIASDKLFLRLYPEDSPQEGIVLNEFEDYYITKNYEDSYEKNYITIKPEVLFKLGDLSPSLDIVYNLSENDVAIYLDALELAKENSQPKVSYSIDLNIFEEKLIHNIYNKLSSLVNINDTDLKFRNVQGYISRIEMDLDHPWQDKIEIKNYRTKFEDLFSTIVASSAQIQKNGYMYDVAASGFKPDGTLNDEVLAQSIGNNSSIIEAYLNSNFDGVEVVNKKLEELFNEAGVLLSSAGNSLVNLRSLSTNNASILSGFYNGVQAGFANGIDYTKEITLLSGDKTNISAVRINKDEGIYMGSNNKIVLSATNAIKGENGEYIGDPGLERSGADVELSPDRLLMGVSNLSSNDAGAVDITSKQILLTVGNIIENLQENSNDITTSNLSGVQIKKDYIGLAAGAGDNRSIVSIKPTDITLGTATADKNGSYIKIAQDKLELGSSADLYINTNNFKLQTNYENKNNDSIGNTIFAIGSNLQGINASTDINDLAKNSPVSFLINQSGAFINGEFTVVGAVQNGYYPFFKVANNTMGIFKSSTATTDLNSSNVEKLLYFEDGNLHVKGDIIASSFQLNGDSFDQAVLNSSLGTQVSNITATNIKVSYYADKNSKTQTDLNQLNDNDWKDKVDEAIGAREKPYYLYTRSVTTYSGGNTSTAYSISYVGKDGEQGAPGDSTAYITTITPLYYLTNGSSAPDKPSDNVKITDTSTEPGGWRTVVPTYKKDYEYYRCTQYEWSEGADNQVTHSNVYKDPGLTAMYKFMTEASLDAANAANAISPITVYGLVGRNTDNASKTVDGVLYDSDGYPTWNNKSYGLILGNSTSKPMLIGSKDGITIAADKEGDGEGEAIALTSGGIALHGGTINLTSALDTTTNIISLGEAGINLASTAEINMETGGKFNISADSGSISLGDYFTIDSEGNLRCKSITCDSINGTLTSKSTTEGEGTEQETTVYNTGYKIWFIKPTRQNVYFDSRYTGEISNFTVKLESTIQPAENQIKIKLSFADSQSWIFVTYLSLELRSSSGEEFFTGQIWPEPNYPESNSTIMAKIGQGYTSIFSMGASFNGGAAIPPGEYTGTIEMTFYNGYGDSYQSCNTVFYPTQSYIQVL